VTLSELLCRVFGHKRDAQRVWHDELDFRSHCIRCDAPMMREPAGKWRPFDPATDDNPLRQPKRPWGR